MKTLADLLKGLAKKSNVNADDEKFKAFFENEVLGKVEIPDELVKPIESQLISISEAKNNHSEIKNHYTASALNVVDTTIDELVAKLGLSDAAKDTLRLEKSSYKKIATLTDLLDKAYQDKAAAGSGDKKALQEEINRLNAEVKAEKDKLKEKDQEIVKEKKNIQKRYAVDSMISPHKTIHDGLPFKTRMAILNTLVEQDMQSNNLKFDLDDSGNVILTKSDGANYHVDNVQVNAQQYIEKVLANNKQLAVNQQQNAASGQGNGTGNNNNNGNQNQPNNASGNNGGKKDSGVFKSLIERAINDVKQADPAATSA